MNSPWSLLPLAYVLCGLAPLVLVPYVRRHEAKPGSVGLLATLFGLSIWAVGIALATAGARASLSYGLLLGAAAAAMVGSHLTSMGYLLLAGEYTGRLTVTRRRVAGLLAALALVLFVTVTDPIHSLVFGETNAPLADQDAFGPVGLGLVFLPLLIGCVSLGLLLVEAITAHTVARAQSLALALAGASTLVFFVVDTFVFTTSRPPIFPLGFAVTGFAYAWALFRADFLDIVPVGRKRIVEEMDDAAIIVDGSDRVVECNPAASRLVGADPDYAGTPAADFFDVAPEMVDRFERVDAVDTEFTITSDGDRRYFHLNISPVHDAESAGTDSGRLIVLRDVTALKAREAELEFLQQIQARVLRHNIRNDLNVIRGYAELLADRGGERDAAIANAITEKSDELLSMSRNARTIERVIDRDEAVEPVNLSVTLSDLVASSRSTYPNASISLSAPDWYVVRTDRWLVTAFEILLENAIAHNDSTRPTVEVSIERTAEAARVTIVDDGPGIPRGELAVLKRGEETPLEHGSGIGLWTVYWIIEHSAASIRFDTGDDGTRVSIRIPT